MVTYKEESYYGTKTKHSYGTIVFGLLVLLLSGSSFKCLGQSDIEMFENHLQYADTASNIDSAIWHGQKAICYAKRLKNDSAIAKSYLVLIQNKIMSGNDLNTSILLADTLYQIASKMNDIELIYQTYRLKGIANAINQNNQKAFSYFSQALEIAKTLHDTLRIADSYNALAKSAMYSENVSTKYSTVGLLKKALEFYKVVGVSQSEMIKTYRNLFDITEKEESIAYYDTAMEIAKSAALEYDIADLYMVRGKKELQNHHYSTAIDFFNKSLKLTKNLGMQSHSIGNYLFIINAYINSNNYFKAYENLQLFDSQYYYHSLPPPNRKYYLRLATDVLSHVGYKDKAIELYRYFVELQDSLAQASRDELLLKFNQQFESDQKDLKIAHQQQAIAEKSARQKQTVLAGVILILASLGVSQWILYHQKKKKIIVEQELKKEKEINEIRTRFLENIAHEIRTPITLVNGYLKLARQQTGHKSKLIKNIDAALSGSNQVLQNTNEILELLKINHIHIPPYRTHISINRFLKRVFFSFESLAEMKHIRLKFYSSIDNKTLINADSSRIEKILNNLISNAVKFSPGESNIIFEVTIQSQLLVAKVRDFGPGIEKDEQDKIFDRFYQARNAQNVGGTGIGLALAKELAKSMDGSISVDSEIGYGSTFIFEMPVEFVKFQKTQKAKIKTSQTPSIDILAENRCKVLIVEDNPEMNTYLKTILSPYFDCRMAFDGEDALCKVQTQNYCLVISDVMMPRMDGFTLKRNINKLKNYKNIPFVFLTAKVQLSDKIEGFSLGIDDYITKPFQKEELLVRIQTLLKNKRERELWVKDHIDFLGDIQNVEEQLMSKIKIFINANLSNENFKVADLAQEVGFSQRQLTRILKKYVGLSPVRYILEVRLQKAYLYLSNQQFATLAEVRHQVGISSRAYFNRKFKERFGILPSDVKVNTKAMVS